MLDDITAIEVLGNKVITIENLTSFHAFNEMDYLVIFLGGFHNKIRRKFIKRLYQENPKANYYHFGDIDAGGFYILEHLRRMTEVDFKPYKMDIEILTRFKSYTKSLTKNDRERLKKLLDTDYSRTIQYMLDNNCKLEQETVKQMFE